MSPDGSRVAYADQGRVWVVHLDGGPPKEVVEGGDPVWTHDGLLLARGRDLYLGQAGRLGSPQTRIHDLAGAGPTDFTSP